MPAPNIAQVAEIVEAWTQEVFDQIQDNARKDFRSKSNALAQSATVIPANVIATHITYQILIDDYYRFIDEGVKGYKSSYLKSRSSRYKFQNRYVGRKMLNAISRWIKNAGIASFKKPQGGRITQLRSVAQQKNSMAWAIATSIKKKGIEATGFFTKAVSDKKIIELETRLTDAMGRKIELDLESVLKGVTV